MDGPTKQLPRGEREKTRGNPFSNMVKEPIYSLVLRIDPGQSRLLPGQNDEDLEGLDKDARVDVSNHRHSSQSK